MDLYNLKNIGKESTINDHYWHEAWPLSNKLLVAIKHDNDFEMRKLLSNPKLFKGRT